MHFDIDKFFDRLQREALSRQEAGQAILREIREAENQKVVFLDQAAENPEFYRLLSEQVNCYILYLRALRKRITGQEEPGGQACDPGKAAAYHTMRLLLRLERLEAGRAR